MVFEVFNSLDKYSRCPSRLDILFKLLYHQFERYEVLGHYEAYLGPQVEVQQVKVEINQVFQVADFLRRFDKLRILEFYSL